MTINGLEITSNFIEIVDENSIHLELGGCIRLVTLSEIQYSLEEIQTYLETLEA